MPYYMVVDARKVSSWGTTIPATGAALELLQKKRRMDPEGDWRLLKIEVVR